MDAKRAIAAVIAFCLGVAIGVAALYSLRPPPRTVVEPIEIESAHEDDESNADRGRARPKRKHSREDRSGDWRSGPPAGQPSDDGGGAAPGPPPLGPADDDGDESDNDDRDGGDADE